jgi:glyoxylase-like metal-dependent hydrolase (beta-lactamase superfamily II)
MKRLDASERLQARYRTAALLHLARAEVLFMHELEVPEEDIVPLDAIAAGVLGVRVLFVNVFALTGPDGWTLVDAGLAGSAPRIRRWAATHFGQAPPQSIVLTHAHFDHVGALESLLAEWNVPVYVHPLEMPYVTGERAYPPPDPSVGGGLMARMASLYPRGPIDLGPVALPLPNGGSLPGLPGWHWIHTPGHTDGHVSLFREMDRALVVGDAFCTTKQESFLAVATQRPELHGPPSYFTTNWDAARDSVQRLAGLRPARLAPGHGQPMAGEDTTAALTMLADEFDLRARPAHGRYVDGRPH